MSGPAFVDKDLALAIHEQTLVQHGAVRARSGVAASALARPRQIAGYDHEADIPRLAAALTSGIVRNHPFVDGKATHRLRRSF